MLLSFFLSGFAGNALNGYALSGVNHHALRQTGHFRRVKGADEIIVDFEPLRPALSRSLRLIDNDFFNQLVQNRRRQFLNIGVFTVESWWVEIPSFWAKICLSPGACESSTMKSLFSNMFSISGLPSKNFTFCVRPLGMQYIS